MSASAEVPTHSVVIFSANTSEPPKCSMILGQVLLALQRSRIDRKSTRLNSSHTVSLHDALPICRRSILVEAAAAATMRGARNVVTSHIWRERDVGICGGAYPFGRHLQCEHFRAPEMLDDLGTSVARIAAIQDRSEEHTSELQSHSFPTRRSSDL